MNLYAASRQWAERPDDERFSTLAELHAAVTRYRALTVEAHKVPFNSLRTEARDGEVYLVGRKNLPAKMAHFAFGQLSRALSAPAAYLRTLPATLAAQNLNHALAGTSDATDRSILFQQNGSLVARAITSEKYSRIWNSDLTRRLLPLTEQGWTVPPARPVRADQRGVRLATEADVLHAGKFELSVKVGDPIAPAGLYASDHDMFVFLVNNEARISEPGNPDGLARGAFLINSEVGASSFYLIYFLYRAVCGNHIVWGAKQVTEIRIPHVGDAYGRVFAQVEAQITRYADESASEDEARIRKAATYVLGATKDEVLDRLFGIKNLGLSRKQLTAAYDLTVEHEPSSVDPNTAWGMAQGLTRLSQETPYADDRFEVDRAAGRVLSIAF